ncbi:glycosyltransferase [Micromonospora sp. NBS 11-29]|uniref:glycosyltransferase n=1 Tax=Micromonospora sp. NBS 11-29 TaxID=1960879 RepID=UPI001594DEBB|nr:glycosyltransferase [Micromonospora sp. NBS 11-29]
MTSPSGRYRVVQILGVLDVGGLEMRTIEMLPHLRAAGAEIHFVTLTGRPGILAPTAERLGAQVHPLALGVRLPLRLVRLLVRLRPRVVHSHVATFSGVLLLLAWLARVPIRIAHFRSDGDEHGNTLRRRVQRWSLRRLIGLCATDIVGVAPGALTSGYRFDWTSDPRCRVVPNGLDVGRLDRSSGFDLRDVIGAAKNELVCVHVGRPSPAKRRWMVPRIVAALGASGVPCHGVLVGARQEEDEERVLAEARAHGVESRLHLLGARDDIGTLMRQADLVLLPSDREGLPGVVLEALAVGTPVVGSDLPGVRFIAERLPGVSLVPRDATPTAWAGAICPLVSPARGERDRADARDAFQASVFSLRSAVDAHLRLYQGVPARPASPTGQHSTTPTTESAAQS